MSSLEMETVGLSLSSSDCFRALQIQNSESTVICSLPFILNSLLKSSHPSNQDVLPINFNNCILFYNVGNAEGSDSPIA